MISSSGGRTEVLIAVFVCFGFFSFCCCYGGGGGGFFVFCLFVLEVFCACLFVCCLVLFCVVSFRFMLSCVVLCCVLLLFCFVLFCCISLFACLFVWLWLCFNAIFVVTFSFLASIPNRTPDMPGAQNDTDQGPYAPQGSWKLRK